MTESEYIMTCDLVRITNAKNIIREIMPEISEIVSKSEYNKVMAILSKWQDKHYEMIETKTDLETR